MAAFAPHLWQANNGGLLPLCAEGWGVGSTNRCEPPSLKVSIPPTPPQIATPTVGPQKACPPSASRWDESRVKHWTKQVIYIDPANQEEGEGSRARPFRDLSKAIKEATSGALLLLAAGSYHWGHTITQPMYIVGTCAGQVRLLADANSKGPAFRVLTGGVLLQGLSIVGGKGASGIGIDAKLASGTLHLEDLIIQQTRGMGISVEGGTLTLRRSKITGTTKGLQSQIALGFGLHMLKTSHGSLIENNEFSEQHSAGIMAYQQGDTIIRANLLKANGQQDPQYGRGISLSAAVGSLRIKDNHIQHNATTGINLSGPQDNVEIIGNLIQRNGNKDKEARGIFVSRSGRRLLITRNTISFHPHQGIAILQPTGVLLTNNLIEDSGSITNQSTQSGLGIAIQNATAIGARIKLEGNIIQRQTFIGVFLDRIKELELTNNLVRYNGRRRRQGYGILLQGSGVGQVALLRDNECKENGDGGLLLDQFATVTLEGNRFLSNGQAFAGTRGAAIQHFGTFEATNNIFQANAESGLYVSQGKRLTLRGNWSVRNTQTNQDIGCGIQVNSVENVALLGNKVSFNRGRGVFINGSQEVQAENNVLTENGATENPKGGLIIYNTKNRVTLRSNHASYNGRIGISIDRSGSVIAEGNLLHRNGKHGFGAGLHIADVDLQTKITTNLIYEQDNVGLDVWNVGDLILTHNWIHHNGLNQPFAVNAGLIANRVRQSLTIKHNVFGFNWLGVFISRIGLVSGQVSGEIQENVFQSNEHGGAYFPSTLAKMRVDKNIWWGNGGAHIWLTNAASLMTITNNIFHGAKAAGGLPALGLPPTYGVAFHSSATGLVRWIFAKKEHDYPCSPTSKGQVSLLPGAWTMRSIRVPKYIDICDHWNINPSADKKTQSLRDKCNSCRKRSMGCRWVWADTENNANQKKGRWSWQTSDVICVSKDVVDTCSQPVSSIGIDPRTVSSDVFSQGVCRPLAAKDNPCLQQDCNRWSQETKYHCSIREEPILGKLRALCLPYDLEKSDRCHPENPKRPFCSGGSACVSLAREYVPENPLPSHTDLSRNLFWQQPGPSLVFDFAGEVVIDQNTFLDCPSKKGVCAAKKMYGICELGKADPTCRPIPSFVFCYKKSPGPACQAINRETHLGYKGIPLPKNTDIVWQRPSLFPGELQSTLNGDDRLFRGGQILYNVDLCQQLVNQ